MQIILGLLATTCGMPHLVHLLNRQRRYKTSSVSSMAGRLCFSTTKHRPALAQMVTVNFLQPVQHHFDRVFVFHERASAFSHGLGGGPVCQGFTDR